MLKIRIHKLKNGRFQTCFLDPKTGKKKRHQVDTLKEAKDMQRNLELRFKTLGISAFNTERIAQLMSFHLEKIPSSKVDKNKRFFRAFMDHFGSYRVCEVTKGDLHAWLIKYKDGNDMSEKSMNGFRTYLNHFFHFLVNENILTSNPLNGVKFRNNVPMRRPRVVLSAEEIQKLLENAKIFSPTVLYPYLYALAHTGARRSELTKLKREDVDFKMGLINLRQTKNGSDRGVKMVPQLLDFMKNHLASHTSEFAFPNARGEKFGQSQIKRLIQSFKHHFPMEKNWHLHGLRHSLAFNFLKAGGEMYQVQAILGHKHIGTTVDIYGQISAQDVDRPSPYNF